ncbi:sulfur carrier protein ThiS [Vibrio sp. SCSIO 43136]|uniref:sulfur carrier protein ThiS n=1 Tax=Vibrio sp. SCSIO 43136 TaxID=2819101 RepID=UPI002075D504|nr:sulfur carrier protein ThiS [Vibrio sp. SCSIO 43136]USD65260.1 sulfur carrier protein ThiS [Vibrio sp. SCSIO 43136]
MIKITINDQTRSVASDSSLEAIVASIVEDAMGYAAAVNQNIVPKQQWSSTTLSEGDSITLFQAIAGG